MADDLDAVLAEIPDEVQESPAVEASTESVEPTKFAELDALLPDADDVDEDFRGKPLADVIRVAKQHKEDAKRGYEASKRLNDAESRARMAEAAVEFARQQWAAQQAAPQQPRETDEAFIQRLANRPTEVLPEVIDQRVAPVVERLQRAETTIARYQADMAQEQAREALGFDRETYQELRPAMAAYMAANGWPISDPRAWYTAGERFREVAARLNPQIQTQPQVEVPRQAAPPGGAARSQVRPNATPKLKARDRENAVDLLDAFGIKPDTPEFAAFEAHVASRQRGVE